MATEMTLIKAVREHLLLPGETIGDFTRMFKQLTDTDKADLSEQFEKEFDYKITRPQAS